MTSSRSHEGLVVLLVACAGSVLTGCGRSDAPAPKAAAPAPPAAGTAQSPAAPADKRETFGRIPCGRLLAIEEVEAAFATKVPMINIVEEGTCDYEDRAGHPVVSVRITTGSGLRCASQDGTYMGKPAEKVDGLGEQGVWSAASGSVCFVKGTDRVQIWLGAQPPEGKTSKGVAADLARKAFSRVPKS